MSASDAAPAGPDFGRGIPIDQIPDPGMVAGQVEGAPVLLVRRGALFHAIGGACTHYGAPLVEGLLTGDTVRCPHHHACFDVRTGRALHGPALGALPRYHVERRLDLMIVSGPVPPDAAPPQPRATGRPRPSRLVLVGAGASATAAAFALRRDGYEGSLTLIGEEPSAPYDRPTLSKGYLGGTASEDWLPLQPPEAYDALAIRLVLGTPVSRLDSAVNTVWLEDGRAFPFDKLLLAPGATPARPPIPGVNRAHVRMLRSRADVDGLITLASAAQRAVVIGAGFLGLEAAAALRERGLAVDVVTPEAHPVEGALGGALGALVQRAHEVHGVSLHLRHSVTAINELSVVLEDGTTLPADVVVVATGAWPRTGLAARAGLVLAHGIQVDRYLETSRLGIFAAGDAVSWPDPLTGELTGCGHWNLAMRMGECAAHNMLGAQTPFDAVPFFWSEHYDLRINCTGNTARFDRIEVVSGLPAGEWEQRYWRGDRMVGVATINRDHANLVAELALERQNAQGASALARMSAGVPQGAHR